MTRLSDAPAGAVVVLADAAGLTTHEANELTRRLEGGTGVLAFGEPARLDEAGRALGPYRPPAAKGAGPGLVQLPALVPARGGEAPADDGALEKALNALLGKGRRAVGATGRARLGATLWRRGEALDVHLVTLGAERAQGTTLFVGLHVAGNHRKARFRAAEGGEVEIRLNPSLSSVSTILPAFTGYAVLSLGG